MNKKKTWLWVVLGVPSFLLFMAIWGLIEPYILDENEEEIVIPNLPSAWEDKRVGQVSDFQIGMWWDNINTVRRSIEELVEEKPAAVLISGDFIYHALPNPETEISKVVELLRPLTQAGIPTYAVLGNHDYGMKTLSTPPKQKLAAKLTAALEEIEIQILVNKAVRLELPEYINTSNVNSSPLYLVGIGAHLAKNDRVDVALSQIPQNNPRIVMMHNPQSFAAFPPQTAPFAIAGHTHGGQIRFPYLPQWSWLALTKKGKVYADGWIEDYGESGNKLYVNRGIGFSDVPIRINCSPEVTFFTLKSED